MTISKIGFVTSTASTVYNYIKESEEPVDRIDIMHYANIDGTALANIEKQNKDIFKFKNNKYYLRSKLVRTDEITKYINEYINQSLSKNKIYIRDVFIYLYKKDKGLLDDNYINSSDDLFSVINVLTIKELDNYEYDKNTNQYVIKSIEMDMFGDEI